MSLDNRKNLMRIAEEAAYSAKGHMKSADWTQVSLRVFIGLPIIISIVLLSFQDINKDLSRLLNCVAFVFSMLAFTSPVLSNPEKAADLIEKHMTLGNDYLQVYKDIRNLVASGLTNNEEINKISDRMKDLDSRTGKLKIGFVARHWSRNKINSEMDLDWIEK